MTPLFAVSVHEIDAGGLARSFELPLAWLERVLSETDITSAAAGHADVRLSRTGHDVIVRGKVKATLTQPCARCLRPTTSDIDGELALVLRPARAEGAGARHTHGAAAKEGPRKEGSRGASRSAGKEAPPDRPSHGNGAARRSREDDEYEFSSEEADQDVYDGEVVVLDDFLREALLLEVPSFPLCSEDCPGIRPASRAAARPEAIDPRLSPLRALKTRLKLAASAEVAEQRAPEGTAPPSPVEVQPSLPAGVQQAESFFADMKADMKADTKAARPQKAARPRIHTHRTAGSSSAKGGSKKSRAKNSPSKKAK